MSRGLPPRPRTARGARHNRGAVDGVADPQGRQDRPGAPPGRPWVGGVPAVAGAGDPAAGLLHRRPAQRHDGLRPCRHRARHPPHPDPRSHRASGPVVGNAAGPEPAHGPRRRWDAGKVRPARPRRQLHRHTRLGVPGCGIRVIRSAVQAPRMNSVMERHAHQVSRSQSGTVERGASHLRQHSETVGHSLRKPEHGGSQTGSRLPYSPAPLPA
jgi:hypothetical protein